MVGNTQVEKLLTCTDRMVSNTIQTRRITKRALLTRPPPWIQTATGSSAVSSMPAGRMTFK